MAEKILIRQLGSTPGNYQWLQLGGPAHTTQTGATNALAAAAITREAVLLLPATMVLLTEAELPIKNSAQIRQALPFVLEDKLAGDIEHYHLAWVRQVNQRLAVAAVCKQALADSLHNLRQAGIEVVAVYPESLCLPYQTDECSLLIEDEQAIFRYGPWLGGGIDVAAMPLLLNKWREQGMQFKTLRIWGQSDLAAWAAGQGVNYVEQASNDMPVLFTGQLETLAPLNLMTGPFLVSRAPRSIKRWWPAAAMLAAALAVQLTSQWQQNGQLQDEAETLEAQTQGLFRKTFPDVKRIVNVRAQADQALQALQKQHQDGGSEFLRMLYAAGEQLAEQPALQLRGLSFVGDVLQLQVLATDAAQLDSLLQALQQGWTVNQQALQTGGQGVEVKIDIKSR